VREVVNAVCLHTMDVLKVSAFGDDVVDPAACPLDSTVLRDYDGKVKE
jgi:hypothetical protein